MKEEVELLQKGVRRERKRNSKNRKKKVWHGKVAQKLSHNVKRLTSSTAKSLKVMLTLVRGQEDVRVPCHIYCFCVFAMIYFWSPIDLIPDVIPCVGYIDDVLVIFLVFWMFKSFFDLFNRYQQLSERLNNVQLLREDYPKEECCICLDQIVNAEISPCKHRFCYDDLHMLKELGRPCPLCRGKITVIIKLRAYV